MANIGKKGLDIPNTHGEGGETEGSPEGQTSGGLTGDQKFNLLVAVAIGFGVACLLAMLAMVHTTFSDYSKAIREYNDKKWTNMEERINKIEILLTPTLTPTPKP